MIESSDWQIKWISEDPSANWYKDFTCPIYVRGTADVPEKALQAVATGVNDVAGMAKTPRKNRNLETTTIPLS